MKVKQKTASFSTLRTRLWRDFTRPWADNATAFQVVAKRRRFGDMRIAATAALHSRHSSHQTSKSDSTSCWVRRSYFGILTEQTRLHYCNANILHCTTCL